MITETMSPQRIAQIQQASRPCRVATVSLVLSLLVFSPSGNSQTVSVGSSGVHVEGGAARIDVDAEGARTTSGRSNHRTGSAISTTAIGPGAHAETNIGSRSVTAGHSEASDRAGNHGPGTGGTGEYVNADLSGQRFADTDWAGRHFVNVDLSDSVLRGANLTRSSMVNVDLSHADLTGADLRGAQMVNVTLDGAVLSGALWLDGRRCGAKSVGKCR